MTTDEEAVARRLAEITGDAHWTHWEKEAHAVITALDDNRAARVGDVQGLAREVWIVRGGLPQIFDAVSDTQEQRVECVKIAHHVAARIEAAVAAEREACECPLLEKIAHMEILLEHNVLTELGRHALGCTKLLLEAIRARGK